MARTRRVICSFMPARHLGGEIVSPPRRIIVEIKPHGKFCVLFVFAQRKKRTHLKDADDPSKRGQPKSFVIRRGRHAVR
jgi:hypothetical protein